jgi:SAM-dependent methyltransferase
MAIEEVYRYPDDYDLEVAARNIDDLPFWLNLLERERPARVLEIGCGTGRLTVSLARMGANHGFHVLGMDIEPAMLIRAEQRAAAEPEAVRRVLKFVKGDVRALKIEQRFDVALMPYGIAHHLTCLEDQLAAWSGVRKLLAPHGLFAVDVCSPDLSLLASAVAGTERHPDIDIHSDDGRHLCRSVATRYFPATQQVVLDFEYDVTDSDGKQRHYCSPFNMHIYYPHELKLLFQQSGFCLESLLGSYNGEALHDDSPLMIALARPTA